MQGTMDEFPSDVIRGNGLSPYKTVFVFSGLMLFMPLFMYFFSKKVIFDGVFLLEGNSSVFYAAVVAVVTVHIVLGLFVWKAFTEKPPPTLRDAKRD